MLNGFTIFIIIAAFMLIIINWYVFYRNQKPGDQTGTVIDIETIKKSNVIKAMIGSYFIFGIIFGLALIFTPYSDWLVMVVILGTALLCVYGSLMHKRWALIPWGAMSILVLYGFFLEIDHARTSLWGIIALITIAVILHLYNKEKSVWN